jgi:hypothetical protein
MSATGQILPPYLMHCFILIRTKDWFVSEGRHSLRSSHETIILQLNCDNGNTSKSATGNKDFCLGPEQYHGHHKHGCTIIRSKELPCSSCYFWPTTTSMFVTEAESGLRDRAIFVTQNLRQDIPWMYMTERSDKKQSAPVHITNAK